MPFSAAVTLTTCIISLFRNAWLTTCVPRKRSTSSRLFRGPKSTSRRHTLPKEVEVNRHNAVLDANMAKADSKGTYGMRAYYRLLQLKASGGLISKVTNADLIWTSLLNDGKPLDVAFGGFCCNLEAVVDGEKKTGTDVAGASKASDAVFKAVTEISEHFAKRMPLALRKEPRYTTYKSAIELELDILNKDFLLLKDAFVKRYQDPSKVQVMSYMEAFPATTEMIEVAKAWRASYNEVREAIMTKMNALLDSDSRFEGCSVIERERFAIGESVKEGDLQAFNVVAHLYKTNKPLLYGAAIAMYNKLLTSPLYIDAVTGCPPTALMRCCLLTNSTPCCGKPCATPSASRSSREHSTWRPKWAPSLPN